MTYNVSGVMLNLAQLNSTKVKYYHTRNRALGPELIPVYRQPAGD